MKKYEEDSVYRIKRIVGKEPCSITRLAGELKLKDWEVYDLIIQAGPQVFMRQKTGESPAWLYENTVIALQPETREQMQACFKRGYVPVLGFGRAA